MEVLASYRRVRADVSLDDLGLARRVEIFEQVRAGGGLVPAVLGAADVLRDPERLLALLCEAARMDFLPAMLAWPAGLRASGGVWAKRWYASLEAWAGIMPMPQERARARRPGNPWPRSARPTTVACTNTGWAGSGGDETTMSDGAEVTERVLAFYLGEPGEDGRLPRREEWFKPDAAFDAAIRGGFLADHEAAAAGVLDGLMESADGCLALVLLLDQFPRNMFRGQARAFATDATALTIARHAVERRWDEARDPVERMFLYMPFEHSEDLAAQERSVALFARLGDEKLDDYAVRHRDIVARFGRFPHRNATLGRRSTAEETAFLAEPGSSF